MANTATLDDIRTAAARRADMVVGDGEFIGRWEANDYVNSALSELHDILVTAYREYFQASDTITLVPGQEEYDLPTDFYKVLAIWFSHAGRRCRVEQFLVDELGDYDVGGIYPLYSGEAYRYRIIGNKMYFTPVPRSAGTFELWYIPQFAKLVDPYLEDGSTDNPDYASGDDVISYAVASGWEEFAIMAAAVKMLRKEESDTMGLEQALLAQKQRITLASKIRDTHRPQRVRDVSDPTRRRRRR